MWFYEEEEELIVQIILEMGNDYLKMLTAPKKMFMSIDNNMKAAKAFRDNMLAVTKDIQDKEIQEKWEGVVEILSRQSLQDLHVELLEQIRVSGNKLIDLDLPYSEHIEIFQKACKGIEYWMKDNIEIAQ